MSQTKLLNIINSVASQIGDPGFVTYAQAEVLAAVNMARGKVYDNHLLGICGAQGVYPGDIGEFGRIYPEWINDNVNYITAITGSTTLTITTKKAHRLISGELITISAVAGFGANPNGDYTVLGTGLTENQFQITHTVSSGAHTANTGKIVVRLSSNEIPKPIDLRMVLSGLLNASIPAITNGVIQKLTAQAYHEAKFNTYSSFASANDALKMYQKPDSVEILAAPSTAITGNVEMLYIAGPVDAVVNAAYNDIVDSPDWMIDIIDFTSEILMSYELE